MAEEPTKRTPPYIPYKTFENFLNGLAEATVPTQIDNSLLRNMSGSTRSGLVVALRYFGLVDQNSITYPALEKLAHAKADERKAQLAGLLSSSYGFLKNMDLKRSTPQQLAEAIGLEGASGGTRDKAVAFFLKAAEAAGVEVSPHILKRKHSITLKRGKRLPGVRKSDGVKPREPKLKVNSNPPPAHLKGRTPYEVLMHEIYDPKSMTSGSEEEKAVFTLARFLKSREVGA